MRGATCGHSSGNSRKLTVVHIVILTLLHSFSKYKSVLQKGSVLQVAKGFCHSTKRPIGLCCMEVQARQARLHVKPWLATRRS